MLRVAIEAPSLRLICPAEAQKRAIDKDTEEVSKVSWRCCGTPVCCGGFCAHAPFPALHRSSRLAPRRWRSPKQRCRRRSRSCWMRPARRRRWPSRSPPRRCVPGFLSHMHIIMGVSLTVHSLFPAERRSGPAPQRGPGARGAAGRAEAAGRRQGQGDRRDEGSHKGGQVCACPFQCAGPS